VRSIKIFRHLVVDVSFEQGKPHLAQRIRNVFLGQLAEARRFLNIPCSLSESESNMGIRPLAISAFPRLRKEICHQAKGRPEARPLIPNQQPIALFLLSISFRAFSLGDLRVS